MEFAIGSYIDELELGGREIDAGFICSKQIDVGC
jgi:hypothetical protein